MEKISLYDLKRDILFEKRKGLKIQVATKKNFYLIEQLLHIIQVQHEFQNHLFDMAYEMDDYNENERIKGMKEMDDKKKEEKEMNNKKKEMISFDLNHEIHQMQQKENLVNKDEPSVDIFLVESMAKEDEKLVKENECEPIVKEKKRKLLQSTTSKEAVKGVTTSVSNRNLFQAKKRILCKPKITTKNKEKNSSLFSTFVNNKGSFVIPKLKFKKDIKKR